MSVDDVNKTVEENFRFVLHAQTSIVITKDGDPPTTYLNQGQAYKLTLNRPGHFTSGKSQLVICRIRITFHDRSLKNREQVNVKENCNLELISQA